MGHWTATPPGTALPYSKHGSVLRPCSQPFSASCPSGVHSCGAIAITTITFPEAQEQTAEALPLPPGTPLGIHT